MSRVVYGDLLIVDVIDVWFQVSGLVLMLGVQLQMGMIERVRIALMLLLLLMMMMIVIEDVLRLIGVKMQRMFVGEISATVGVVKLVLRRMI